MRRKIVRLLCAGICFGLLLTGCGKEKASEKNENVDVEQTTEKEEKESVGDSDQNVTDSKDEEESKEEIADEPKEDTTEDSKDNTEEESEEDVAESVSKDVESEPDTEESESDTAIASEGFINFEKMEFKINGKSYELGKVTLKDMIDDGVPFDEDDLANAGNNLNGNSQSQGFKIVLGEYWSAQVYVMNDSDENKVASDCFINEIYFPNSENKSQDILTFAFQITLTEDELKKVALKPTDVNEYKDGDYTDNTYKYMKESTKYLNEWGYTFEFTNGKLSYVTMRYLK